MSTLRLALRDIVVRPPRKYSSSLISDVFPLVKSALDIDDVLSSGYFHTVAWKFFHSDITNNHLQLILITCYYEIEFTNLCSCMDLMASDPAKLQDLILRVMQTTLNASDPNIGLLGASFLFLGVLVRYDASLLHKSKLYKKWRETCLELYITTYYALDVPVFPGFTKCLLYFCICSTVVLEDMRIRVQEVHILLYFTLISNEAGEALVRRLGNILSVLTEKETKRDFEQTQIRFKNASLGPEFDFLTMAFSPFDISHSQLESALGNLEQSKLKELAQLETIMSTKPLIEYIVQSILGPRMPYSRVFDMSQFDEDDLFDILDTTEFPELPINPLIPYKINDINTGEQARLGLKIQRQINLHLVSSLGRLSITDGRKDDGIKGKSKYFHRLESVQLSGCIGKLTTKGLGNIHGYVVLLEIGKPIDYDGRFRVKKLGIQAAKLVKVASSLGNQVLVHGIMKDFEDRFNALITLPETILVDSLLCLHEALGTEPFLIDDVPPEVSEMTIPSIDMAIAEEIDNISIEKGETRYNGCKIVPKESDSALSADETSALLSMLSSRVSLINGSENSGQQDIVNNFLETLSINFPKQRCLVILPSRLSVLMFPAKTESTFKIGGVENISNIIRTRHDLLQRVEKLSNILGLSDYAFNANATNALMLYDAHIVPKWKAYLKQLKNSQNTIERYPFKKFEFNTETTEVMLTKVVDDYLQIKSTFSGLQELLPLDKTDDHTEMAKFLATRAKYVFACPSDLCAIEDHFDNIVCFTSCSEVVIPIARNQDLKRLIFFQKQFSGIAKLASTCVELSLKGVRSEIATLTGRTCHVKPKYNPGIRYSVQQIQVPTAKSHVNVEEARYVAYLFQYMRLLGYPYHGILIVASPYMKMLIEEILEERKIARDELPSDTQKGFRFGWPHIQEEPFACDYIIVASHPGLSMRQYVDVAKCARLALYIVGATCTAPYKIKMGDFELYAGVTYTKGTDNRAKSESYIMEGPDHMGEYTEQMTKMRRGG